MIAVAASMLVAAGFPQVLCSYGGTDAAETLYELSGLARSQVHPHVLWATNDSGDAPRLYGIDDRTCRIVATLTIKGVEATDQEALASGVDARGRPVIWVGDIGDNRAKRDHVTVRMIRDPEELGDASVEARSFRFSYPTGPVDAESLIADPKGMRLWVITKESKGRLFEIPLIEKGIVEASFVAEMPGTLTDAAISPDGNRLVARDYISGWLWAWPALGAPEGLSLPLQPQGEAITWGREGASVITGSEKSDALMETGLTETGQIETGPIETGIDPSGSPSAKPTSGGSSGPGTDSGVGQSGLPIPASTQIAEKEGMGSTVGLSPSLLWIAVPALGAVGLWVFRRR